MNRFLRLNYCICEEERTYDVDGWLDAWKIVLSCADGSGEDYKLLPSGPASLPDEQVPISHNDDNVYWKELLMIVYVWVAFLIVQILKSPLRSLKPNSYAKDQGDCVQRKGNHKLEVASDFSVLQLWDSSWYSSTQDKIHSILFVSQKILSRNPWQGKISEEVWIQNSLIIGFDPKSSTAISKCMIMGASVSTVYFNLRLRHPTLDMPLIDYDLAFLFQPMLVLGISIGVAFNVMFADWMDDNYEATVNNGSNESDKLSLLPFPSRLGYFSPSLCKLNTMATEILIKQIAMRLSINFIRFPSPETMNFYYKKHILKLAPPHWVVWEVLGVEAMLALIIGFDPKSSTAISKYRTEELYAILCRYDNGCCRFNTNAHARHQHRSFLQRHVRQLDGHSSTYIILFLDILLSSGRYSSKSFNKGHRNMEERDNDEEESRKAVGISVQTWRFLRLNYCICEEERTYDVDGWLDAWKVSGFMSMERILDRIKELHAILLVMQGMIMGASVSTVYFNLRLRHPTLDMPFIDYDLAFLFRPMLVLGISIGVAFNVMFADWMVTVLLIILFFDILLSSG
ncbi:unnamed protein product [Prunus armeniaca]